MARARSTFWTPRHRHMLLVLWYRGHTQRQIQARFESFTGVAVTRSKIAGGIHRLAPVGRAGLSVVQRQAILDELKTYTSRSGALMVSDFKVSDASPCKPGPRPGTRKINAKTKPRQIRRPGGRPAKQYNGETPPAYYRVARTATEKDRLDKLWKARKKANAAGAPDPEGGQATAEPTCRWIHGDVKFDDDWQFCGHDLECNEAGTPIGSWCPYHAGKAKVPARAPAPRQQRRGAA